MRRHLRRWGAVHLLLALFIASWIGQAVAMAPRIRTEGWITFWASTFENWQSEWLQLAVQALVVVGWAEILFRRSLADVHRLENKVDQVLTFINLVWKNNE